LTTKGTKACPERSRGNTKKTEGRVGFRGSADWPQRWSGL